MSTDARPRVLVLGGGGLAGVAWEVGVLVGLADAGVDVTGAERIVGTSAGSIVGALVATGADLAAVHAGHCDPVAAPTRRPRATPASLDVAELMAALAEAVSGARDARDARARIGAWALSADTPHEAERREIIAARLPDHRWPDRDLRITAVDAGSGDAVVFTGVDGVELVDAVGASCAVPGVWPPVTIGDRRYLDGGVRSIVCLDEVDRAVDPTHPTPAGPVLVVAPLDPPAGSPLESVGAEVERRRAAAPDAGIVAVLADEESRAAFGPNVLDPASMPPSAEAGRRQGRAAAAEVAALWTAG